MTSSISPVGPAAAHADRGSEVSIRSLSKTFGERRVLTEISLDIGAGEFVAIVGRSGCGKSTLLRLVAGLDQPDVVRRGPHDAAPIRLHGRPQDGIDPTTRILFQDARLLPWRRVVDNVALGLAREGRERAKSVLAEVGLADRAHDWPAVLSGGQRQRVALARALVHEPALLLLDEPLGALDALTRIEMQQLIERVWLDQGFTAILVTHDVTEAVALANRVVLIEHGRITLDLAIELERPRERGTAAFARYERDVLHHVLQLAKEPFPEAASERPFDIRSMQIAV